MSKSVAKRVFTVGLLAALMALPVYGATINKSVRIDAGSESDGASSVNGSISVGEGATVSGSIDTVNGKIRVDEDASIRDASTVNGGLSLEENVKARSLETVNGSISVGANGEIDGDVGAVNGRIHLQKGTTVSGDLGNVNGDIEIEGAEVGGNVTTTSGDVELSDAATIKGDLVIEKPGLWGFGNKNNNEPEIVIGPGSAIEGRIVLQRKVKLYISDSARVGAVEGEMSMDDAIRFSGARP